jgi:hypothetical protein
VICFSIAQVALTKTTWSRKLKIFTIWLSTERVSWLPVTLLKKQNQHKLYIYIYINEKRCSRNHTDLNSAPNQSGSHSLDFIELPMRKELELWEGRNTRRKGERFWGAAGSAQGIPEQATPKSLWVLTPLLTLGWGSPPGHRVLKHSERYAPFSVPCVWERRK